MDHTFHSETAKNAVGAAAKPPPKKSFGRNSGFTHKFNSASKNKKSFSKNNKTGNRFKQRPRRE